MPILQGRYKFNTTLAMPEELLEIEMPCVPSVYKTIGYEFPCYGFLVSPTTLTYVFADYVTHEFYILDGGWNGEGSLFRDIEITEPVELDDAAYDWFIANTTEISMIDVSGVWTLNDVLELPVDDFIVELVIESFFMISPEGIAVDFQDDPIYTPTDGWVDESVKTLDFGEGATVSSTFYDWLVANTGVMETISGIWKFNKSLELPEKAISSSVIYDTLFITDTPTRLSGMVFDVDNVKFSGEVVYSSDGWVSEDFRVVDFGEEARISDKAKPLITANAVQIDALPLDTISGIWKFNDVVTLPENAVFSVMAFETLFSALESTEYEGITVTPDGIKFGGDVVYSEGAWVDDDYKVVNFGEADVTVSETFKAFIVANSVKMDKLPDRFVTYNLTKCASNNPNQFAEREGVYSATLIPNDKCELMEVKVVMGGVDITSSVVDGRTITIPSVTGDIVISAYAMDAEWSVKLTTLIGMADKLRNKVGIEEKLTFPDEYNEIIDKLSYSSVISEGNTVLIESASVTVVEENTLFIGG